MPINDLIPANSILVVPELINALKQARNLLLVAHDRQLSITEVEPVFNIIDKVIIRCWRMEVL